MIVGLCGFAGAGKGAVAEYLGSKGFSHYSVKSVIREELERRGMAVTRDNLIMMANTLRADGGSDVLIQRILRKMPGEGLAVIESLRNPDEVAALRQRKDFVLLALDAPVPVRLRRLAARGRAGDPMTPEELRRLDEREAADPSKSGIRIKECMALADVLIINDSTLAQLHLQIDDALRRAGKR